MVIEEMGKRLTNIIVGGGGKKIVVELTSKTSVEEVKKHQVDYCFEDNEKKPINKILIKANVKILFSNAIFNYLMSKEVTNKI